MQDQTTTAALTQKEFNLFRELIYKEAGISLGDGKQQLVASRLSKRLRACDLTTFTQYYDFLKKGDPNGEERLRMINSLTTNKTDFFRESHHFEYLRRTVFPQLEKQARETGERKIRIWSAACSTGEEPYTLAMTVLDHFGPTTFHGWDIRILASDVDTDVLAHAQKGLYEADRVADVPRDVLKRHFLKTSKDPEAPLRIRPELQEMITFRRINFIEPAWPIQTDFDIIFCRNVMIYFDEKTQDTLLTRFSEQLKPNGHLFIGHSESILRLDDLYQSLGNTVYQLSSKAGAARRPPANAIALKTKAASISPGPTAEHQTGQTAHSDSGSHRRSTGRVQTNTGAGPAAPVLLQDNELLFPTQSIIVGEIQASAEPMKVTTLVGSCIAVCLYDPVARIGGMNHFMLPSNAGNDRICASYGIHAMELLINQIMKLGGDRRRLNAKVFGGGNVLARQEPDNPVWAIGDRNIRFAIEFLETDSIPVVAKDVGGESGRQVQFLTHTGQAFIRPLQKCRAEIEADLLQMRRIRAQQPGDSANVILF